MNAIELEKYVPPFRSLVLNWMLRARPDFVLSMDPVDMMRRLGSERGSAPLPKPPPGDPVAPAKPGLERR
jgi:hypothetical protein